MDGVVCSSVVFEERLPSGSQEVKMVCMFLFYLYVFGEFWANVWQIMGAGSSCYCYDGVIIWYEN